MADEPKFVLFAIRGMPEKEVKFVRRMQEEFKKIRIDCIQCEGNQDFDIGLSISDAGHELEDGIILTSADYSSEWLLSSGLTTVIFDETLGENLPYGFDMIVESFEEMDAGFFVKLWKHKNNIPCIISESKRTVLRELCEKDINEVMGEDLKRNKKRNSLLISGMFTGFTIMASGEYLIEKIIA